MSTGTAGTAGTGGTAGTAGGAHGAHGTHGASGADGEHRGDGVGGAGGTGHQDGPAPVAVLVVDDQALVRAGFRLILAHEPRLVVVGEAGDGVEAVAAARRLRPDVVLMDVRMPRMDGIEATERIRDLPHAPAVVVLTTFDVDEYVYRAMRAGACGFLLKDAPQEQLVAAVHAAAVGMPTVAPAVIARMAAQLGPRDGAAERWPALAELTAREVDVLRALASGASNAQIARELFVGESTVKSHVANVLAKLRLANRAQAVVVAYESGLVGPGAPAPGGAGGRSPSGPR